MVEFFCISQKSFYARWGNIDHILINRQLHFWNLFLVLISPCTNHCNPFYSIYMGRTNGWVPLLVDHQFRITAAKITETDMYQFSRRIIYQYTLFQVDVLFWTVRRQIQSYYKQYKINFSKSSRWNQSRFPVIHKVRNVGI